MTFLSIPLQLGIVILICVYAYKRVRDRRSRLPLPPGPKKLPLIGNLLDVPQVRSWEAYHKWAQELGSDIVHLNMAGQNVIILDTYEAAHELFERRSSRYSDRPHSPMLSDLMGWDFVFPFQNYNERVKAHQRITRRGLNATEVLTYRPYTTRAARRLLKRFLDKSEARDVMGNIRFLAAEIAITVVYGFNTTSKRDYYVELAEKANKPISKTLVPGAFLVEFFPFLKYVPSWVPGAGFKKQAEEWRGYTEALRKIPFDEVKQRIAVGTANVSFVSRSLDDIATNKVGKITEEDIRDVAVVQYLAGTDTSMGVIANCILTLMNFPDVAKRAQAELDSVVGFGNLPTFEHEPLLPYLSAVIKECLRWKTSLPLALPHVCTEDDEYRGYRIPKGSFMLGNLWAILRDESIYASPMEFKPDRFLSTQKGRVPRDPDFAVWGIGRRACLGRYLASSTIWITVASLLAAFDLERVNSGGGLDHPDIIGMMSTPCPFECGFRPRSKDLEELIKAQDLDE